MLKNTDFGLLLWTKIQHYNIKLKLLFILHNSKRLPIFNADLCHGNHHTKSIMMLTKIMPKFLLINIPLFDLPVACSQWDQTAFSVAPFRFYKKNSWSLHVMKTERPLSHRFCMLSLSCLHPTQSSIPS